MIVANRRNKLIKIFHPNGQFLRKIGRGRSFTYPFLCVQYESYLVVSDSEENYIKFFGYCWKISLQIWNEGEASRRVHYTSLLVS